MDVKFYALYSEQYGWLVSGSRGSAAAKWSKQLQHAHVYNSLRRACDVQRWLAMSEYNIPVPRIYELTIASATCIAEQAAALETARAAGVLPKRQAPAAIAQANMAEHAANVDRYADPELVAWQRDGFLAD